MRLSIIWPQLDSLAIMSNRPVSVALIAESDAQIVMRHPANGILCQCCCVKGDKIVVDGSLSPRKKAQQKQKCCAHRKEGRFLKCSRRLRNRRPLNPRL